MKRFKSASDIKVGVIGYGGAFNMGRHHLNEMKQAGMTPVAVAEIDPKRLEVAAQDFPGIGTYSSIEEMLRKSDVNLLAIITPHNTHAKLAIQCLKAGRHVVCEKPMAVTTKECDSMIAEAKKRGLLLSTYHNRHWDGIILGVMEQVRSGVIGEVVRVETRMGGWGKPGDWWRSSKTISGGILYDWGVHLLEYTLQIVNSDIVEVSGYLWKGVWARECKWKDDTIEDDGFVMVRYSSGAWSLMTMSSIESRPVKDWFKVTGTKGALAANWDAVEVVTHDGPRTTTVRIPNPPGQSPALYKNIADHLVEGVPLVITAEWARRPIHILDLACRSAAAGRAMKAVYR